MGNRFLASLKAAGSAEISWRPQYNESPKQIGNVSICHGNDLAWSPDSRTVYASRPNDDRPEVSRISLRDGKSEPAVDLTDFSELLGRIPNKLAPKL